MKHCVVIGLCVLLQSLLRQEELRQPQRNAIRPSYHRQVRYKPFSLIAIDYELTVV